MDVKYAEDQVIRGFSIITNNQSEMTSGEGRISALWKRFDAAVPVN